MEHNINRVQLCGSVETAPAFSHENHGVDFYAFTLSIPRLSGVDDVLPILAPAPLVQQLMPRVGDTVSLQGQLRSFNNRSGEGHRLLLSVFAHNLTAGGEVPCNRIQLSGVLCKSPTLRRTPLGRNICDVLLAVNRRYGRADYLPCIAWGAVAQQLAACDVGERVTVEGRVQSRLYTKQTEAGSVEHTAYEVSIMRPAEVEEFLL